MQQSLCLRAQELIVAGLLLTLCGCDFVAAGRTATPILDPSRSSSPASSPTAIPVVEPPTPIIDQAHLYPTPTVGFDVFKHYPGAEALKEYIASPGRLPHIEF